MNSKVNSGFIIFNVLLSILLSCGLFLEVSNNIDGIELDIDYFDECCNETQIEINYINSNITYLSNEIIDVNYQLDNISEDIAILENATSIISNLTDNINTLNNSIIQLNQTIYDINNTINGILSDIYDEIDLINDELDSIDNSIYWILQNISAIEDLIDEIQTELLKCAFRGSTSSGQVLSTGTYTNISFSEEYDLGLDFLGIIFEAPIDGIYHFDAGIMFVSTSSWNDGESVRIRIKSNNGYFVTRLHEIEQSESSYQGETISTDMYLNQGNWVWVEGYQSCGGNLALFGGSEYNFFSGHLVCLV